MVTTRVLPSLSNVELVYKANKYPVPRDPYLPKMFFVGLFVGSRGSGKTYSCVQLLKLYENYGISNPMQGGRPIDQRIILISPTSEANPVFNSLKHLSHDDVHTHYSDAGLLQIIADVRAEKEATDEYQRKLALFNKFRRMRHVEQLNPHELAELEMMDFMPPDASKVRFPAGVVTFMVLDDLVGTAAFKAVGQSALTNLVLKNRHLSINICICTQNLKAIPKSIRANASLFVIFRFGSQKMICEDLYEEVSGLMTLEQFCELYAFATNTPNSPLIIDHSQPPEFRTKRGWDTAISV